MSDALARPSPWNYFVRDEALCNKVEEEQGLAEWAQASGLPEDSKFLAHWFGVTKEDDDALTEQLPRPSPWNQFVTEEFRTVEPEQHNALELRKFAHDSGLAGDSKFLAHWFGLADAGTAPMSDALARPSPWNYFVRDEALCNKVEEEQGLAEWAQASGLPEDSKFLAHWFGVTKANEKALSEQLPRPSPWNQFVQVQ